MKKHGVWEIDETEVPGVDPDGLPIWDPDADQEAQPPQASARQPAASTSRPTPTEDWRRGSSVRELDFDLEAADPEATDHSVRNVVSPVVHSQPITCQHCGHAQPVGYFCDGCGLRIDVPRPVSKPEENAIEQALQRCTECGTRGSGSLCRNCGARLPGGES